MKKPYAPDWTPVFEDGGLEYSHIRELYWLDGKVYDHLSATHNGLIGPGAQLKQICKGVTP